MSGVVLADAHDLGTRDDGRYEPSLAEGDHLASRLGKGVKGIALQNDEMTVGFPGGDRIIDRQPLDDPVTEVLTGGEARNLHGCSVEERRWGNPDWRKGGRIDI